MTRTFENALRLGREGERLMARWLMARGWGVIPAYEYTGTDGNKAPRLSFASRRYALPDFDCCRKRRRIWVETKTYGYAPRNKRLNIDVHGIPRRLYEHYQVVEAESGCPVWLAIVELRTAALLAAPLHRLQVYPCQCPACSNGRRSCCAPLTRGVYFNRADFTLQHRFDPTDIGFLRVRDLWQATRPPA